MTAPVPASPPRPRSERGVALLIVLVVLFIIAVLMVDITLTATTARRSARNASSDFLMDAAIEAHFQVMLAQLRYDRKDGKGANDSPDDRWAREEFAEVKPPEKDEDADADTAEEEGVRLLGDSEDVGITSRIEPENAKFNLYLLWEKDAKAQREDYERFVVLLDRFREGTPLDISRTRAEELAQLVHEAFKNDVPGASVSGKLPRPKTRPWRLLTPDSLRYVEGFEDTTHGLGPEGLLYDAREPSAAREYSLDPDNVEKPEVYKGLVHYITTWSGDAWKKGSGGEGAGEPDQATWRKINVNFAEKPILETLFKNPANYNLVDQIIEYREAGKEGSTAPAEGETVDVDQALPEHQYFAALDDLWKVPQLDSVKDKKEEFLQDLIVFDSQTFSLDFLARLDKSFKQVRYVVRRDNSRKSLEILLREERADPRFDDEEETGEE